MPNWISLIALLGLLSQTLWAEYLPREYFPRRTRVRAMSPDYRYAAVCQVNQGTLNIYDLLSGAQPFVRIPSFSSGVAHPDSVSVTFSPDSRELVVGHWDGIVARIDAATGQEVASRKFSDYAIRALAVGPDPSGGNYLLVTTVAGTALYSLESFLLLQNFGTLFPTSQGLTYTSAFHPNGDWAIEGDSEHGAIRLFDLRSRIEVFSNGGAFHTCRDYAPPASGTLMRVGFAADRDKFSFVGWAGQASSLIQWVEHPLPASTGSESAQILVSGGVELGLRFHSISADGNKLISSHLNCVKVLTRAARDLSAHELSGARSNNNNSAVISPDGKMGAAMNDDGELYIWDLSGL